MLVFLLPGKKTDDKLYSPLKGYLNSSVGIPSQIVLNATLEKGKNLLSIVSKVLLQIAAKMNLRPWVNDTLPLMTEPVMIVGLDITKKNGSTNICFVYSTDNKAAKYTYGLSKVKEDWSDFNEKLSSIITEAIERFNSKCPKGVTLKRIIVYRDGLSKGEHTVTKVNEFDALRKVCTEKDVKKFNFIVVNKKVSVKFFKQNGQALGNPEPGTVVT